MSASAGWGRLSCRSAPFRPEEGAFLVWLDDGDPGTITSDDQGVSDRRFPFAAEDVHTAAWQVDAQTHPIVKVILNESFLDQS